MKTNGVVVLEGGIGAGKSTLAKAITKAFHKRDLHAEYIAEPDEKSNPFLELYYADPKRWAFTIQSHLLSERTISTQYAQCGAASGKGWFIMDRSFFGDICFAKVQVKNGYFTREEYEAYLKQNVREQSHISMPDVAIFLRCDTKRCIERIKKRNRTCEAGVSEDYLMSIQTEVIQLEEAMSCRCRTLSLDWNNDLSDGLIFKKASDIVDYLVNPATEKTDYITNPFGNLPRDIFQIEGI